MNSRKKKEANPFYVLLLLAGGAFAITACAYGVMTVRQMDTNHSTEAEVTTDRFSVFMDRHGARMMLLELVALGIGTFGAIAYDEYTTRID